MGAYGYNRDGKRGKLQIVIGLWADEEGEPLAVRVFEGNRSDPTTVVEQIQILQEQIGVEELVFVGDRGMVKSKGKQALTGAGLRYITALTDPQIRRLLAQGTLQLSLFSEQVCEVQGEEGRYILRRNPQEAQREQHRLDDKLAKLEAQLQARNEQVRTHPRCQPEAGQRAMEAWVGAAQVDGPGSNPTRGHAVETAAERRSDPPGAGVGGLLCGDDRRGLLRDERPASA